MRITEGIRTKNIAGCAPVILSKRILPASNLYEKKFLLFQNCRKAAPYLPVNLVSYKLWNTSEFLRKISLASLEDWKFQPSCLHGWSVAAAAITTNPLMVQQNYTAVPPTTGGVLHKFVLFPRWNGWLLHMRPLQLWSDSRALPLALHPPRPQTSTSSELVQPTRRSTLYSRKDPGRMASTIIKLQSHTRSNDFPEVNWPEKMLLNNLCLRMCTWTLSHYFFQSPIPSPTCRVANRTSVWLTSPPFLIFIICI